MHPCDQYYYCTSDVYSLATTGPVISTYVYVYCIWSLIMRELNSYTNYHYTILLPAILLSLSRYTGNATLGNPSRLDHQVWYLSTIHVAT